MSARQRSAWQSSGWFSWKSGENGDTNSDQLWTILETELPEQLRQPVKDEEHSICGVTSTFISLSLENRDLSWLRGKD